MKAMSGKRVSIILPALNEEDTIGRIIDEVPKCDMEGIGYRVKIVVVDNNSTDMTMEIAEKRVVD